MERPAANGGRPAYGKAARGAAHPRLRRVARGRCGKDGRAGFEKVERPPRSGRRPAARRRPPLWPRVRRDGIGVARKVYLTYDDVAFYARSGRSPSAHSSPASNRPPAGQSGTPHRHPRKHLIPSVSAAEAEAAGRIRRPAADALERSRGGTSFLGNARSTAGIGIGIGIWTADGPRGGNAPRGPTYAGDRERRAPMRGRRPAAYQTVVSS